MTAGESFSPHVALFGQHVLLDDPKDIIDNNSPKPHDKFAHRFAAKFGEIAVGLEKRLLDDVGRADAGPEPVVELSRHQEF